MSLFAASELPVSTHGLHGSTVPRAPSSAGLGAKLAERHRLRGLYELGDHPLLERQWQRESNARSYPRRLPLALSRAQGVYVEDVDGRDITERDIEEFGGMDRLMHACSMLPPAFRQMVTDAVGELR